MKPTELIEHILQLSKADDCIVLFSEDSNANVRWANNTTTTNGVAFGQDLIIIAIRDRRTGIVHRSAVDPANLEALVREAEAACEFNQPAEDYAEPVSGDGTPNDWTAPSQPTSIEVFSRLAPQLAEAFATAETAEQKLFGFATHSSSTLYLANSRGLRRRHTQVSGQIEITAKTADFATSSWVGQATNDFADVEVPQLIAKLQQRLDWSKTKLDLPAGRYDTLLEPSAVADLLIYAYWTASAREADDGNTVFSKPGGGTKVGEKLFDERVTVYSDPHEPGLSVWPFEMAGASSSHQSVFDNGLNLNKTAWFENGTLKHLIAPRAFAASHQMDPRPYIDNLIFPSPSEDDLETMIKGIKRGLLVTCLWYIREVDPQRLLLTGLTRDGVFLIEDGEVKGAVNNFRFNMSPTEMLSQIKTMGVSGPTLAREWGDYFTFAKMPPLVIEDFNMSSVSQAT